MYTIYHIPGKKIGVTRNINKRVTEQQGYAPDEYEVLLTSEDINYISTMEIELQKSYGYKVDRQTYKNLINKRNKMNINATEQTSTFPCPLNKLKGQLMDNLDLSWETSHGTFKITKDNIPWILSNARTSMFDPNRCYVYNKAFSNLTYHNTPNTVMFDRKKKKKKKKDTQNLYDLIRAWATEKGIYKTGDSRTQYVKLMEEAGELAQALLKNDETEVIDAIGDMVVVLTNLAKLRGHNIEDCIASAYSVIKDRQGKMINGTFVKDVVGNAAATFTLNHSSNRSQGYLATNTL
jgi:NTP pyrophosphatase (non-canonical NTP hydrolase)